MTYLQKCIKCNKITNILCAIYGVYLLLLTTGMVLIFLMFDHLIGNESTGSAFVEFIRAITCVLSALILVIGIIFAMAGIVYIILCVTGHKANKHESINGLLGNSICKALVSATASICNHSILTGSSADTDTISLIIALANFLMTLSITILASYQIYAITKPEKD